MPIEGERPPRPEGEHWRWGPPPTEAQRRAHAEAHPDSDGDGWWQLTAPQATLACYAPASLPVKGDRWWRPIRSIPGDPDPVPWPTPTAEEARDALAAGDLDTVRRFLDSQEVDDGK